MMTINTAIFYMSEYEAIFYFEEYGFAKHAHIKTSRTV